MSRQDYEKIEVESWHGFQYFGENWMWCGKSMTIKHSQFSYTPLCWEDTIFNLMGKVFPSLTVRMEYRSLLVLVQSCNKVNVFDQGLLSCAFGIFLLTDSWT